MKKKNKALADLVTCMITMLIMFVVLYLGVIICVEINLGIKKARIERTYLLAMETEGYLSAENMALMAQELADIGVINISFEGTTVTPAGYGNYVYLSVSGKIETSGIQGISADSWSWIRGDNYIDFKIKQKSTAKY